MRKTQKINVPAHPVTNNIGVAHNDFEFVMFSTLVVVFFGGCGTMKMLAESSFNPRMMMVGGLYYFP